MRRSYINTRQQQRKVKKSSDQEELKTFANDAKIKKLNVLDTHHRTRIALSKKKSTYIEVKIALNNIELRIKKSKCLSL